MVMLRRIKVGRQRLYATNAERQAAYRERHHRDLLRQIPVVHGEGYTIYQGDAVALVPLLSGYAHCITDPPYEAEAHTRTRRTRAYLEGRAPYAAIDFAPITDVQRRLFARLRCGWIIVFSQVEAIGRYQALFGAKYKRALTWIKPDSTPQLTGDRPAMGSESIVCAWGQPGRSHWNSAGKRGIYTHLVRDGETRVHPTQKPLALMRELVRDFTKPGEVILDPFAGSGTTGAACLALGRRFIGIEQDPRYFRMACARLEAVDRQGQLFAVPQRVRQEPLFSA
jgi:site-specific DNA-methyltransferase (adenine-specific)